MTSSLRERKRDQTRASIQHAALDLVLDDGLEAATVDAIADRAGISQRTFFNYFESKDAAILGVPPRERQQQVLDQACSLLSEGADTAHTVVRMVMALTGAHQADAGQYPARRREVLRRHPQVLASMGERLADRTEELAARVQVLLASDPAFDDLEDSLADQAMVVLMMAGCAVRRSLESWALEARAEGAAAPDTASEIERRAVSLLRSTARGLA